jgi:hypothetical protein
MEGTGFAVPDSKSLLSMFTRVSQERAGTVKVRALLASMRDYTDTATHLLMRDQDDDERRNAVRDQIAGRSKVVAKEFLDASAAAGEEVAPWNYTFLARQLARIGARTYAATGAVPEAAAMRMAVETIMATAEASPPRVFADLPRTIEVRLALMENFVPHAGRGFEEILDRTAAPRFRALLFSRSLEDEAAWREGYDRAIGSAMDDLAQTAWKTAGTICDQAEVASEKDRVIAAKSVMASIASMQAVCLSRAYRHINKEIKQLYEASPETRRRAVSEYFERYGDEVLGPLAVLSKSMFTGSCEQWWARITQQSEIEAPSDLSDARAASSASI